MTGTEKVWQCFAVTAEAKRAKINDDGRYMMRRMSLEQRSCNAQDGEEATVEFVRGNCSAEEGFIRRIDCGEEILEGEKAVVLFTY